jgi:hypothetical protein
MKKFSPTNRKGEASAPSADAVRLPASSSVLTELSLTSPKGRKYRVLRSAEQDATDAPQKPKRSSDEGR